MSKWWQVSGDLYTCEVQGFFTEVHLNANAAEGKHLSGKSNNDVKGFYLHDSISLEQFPRNVNKIFKNLEMIFIYSTNIRDITNDDLKAFPNLKYFYIKDTPIQVIRDDLFTHNPHIEVISLFNNKINHVEKHSFSNLSKLRALSLQKNSCDNLGKAENREEILELIKKIEEEACIPSKKGKNPLEMTVEELRIEISTLREELSIKDGKIEQFEIEIQKFQTDVQKYQLNIENLKQQNQNCVSESKKNVEKVQKLEINIEVIINEKKVITTENTNLKNTIQECHQEVIILTQQTETFTQTVSGLQQKIQQCEEKSQNFEKIERLIDSNTRKMETKITEIITKSIIRTDHVQNSTITIFVSEFAEKMDKIWATLSKNPECSSCDLKQLIEQQQSNNLGTWNGNFKNLLNNYKTLASLNEGIVKNYDSLNVHVSNLKISTDSINNLAEMLRACNDEKEDQRKKIDLFEDNIREYKRMLINCQN